MAPCFAWTKVLRANLGLPPWEPGHQLSLAGTGTPALRRCGQGRGTKESCPFDPALMFYLAKPMVCTQKCRVAETAVVF